MARQQKRSQRSKKTIRSKRKSRNARYVVHVLKLREDVPFSLTRALNKLADSLDGYVSIHSKKNLRLFTIPKRNSAEFIAEAEDILDDYEYNLKRRIASEIEKKDASTQVTKAVEISTQT